MPDAYRNGRDPLRELVAVMDRLRSPGGCPWDAQQTHESLVGYLVEESYETIEAIETQDPQALQEELGDLLLQVVFHARIASEGVADFDIDDVARGIVDKLVRRHPHVFADGVADSAAHVEEQWHARKVAEKGRTSVTDGVPLGMPALLLASKLMKRAANGQVQVEVVTPEVATIARTTLDATAAAAKVTSDGPSAVAAEEQALGQLLLALVAEGRSRGVDAEAVLRGATREYRDRLVTEESKRPVPAVDR